MKSKVNQKKRLRVAFGDACYWCGLPMDFPNYGNPDTFHSNMATLEHHIQKTKPTKSILYLRLVHQRCNK